MLCQTRNRSFRREREKSSFHLPRPDGLEDHRGATVFRTPVVGVKVDAEMRPSHGGKSISALHLAGARPDIMILADGSGKLEQTYRGEVRCIVD